jgi:hypothetical protein
MALKVVISFPGTATCCVWRGVYCPICQHRRDFEGDHAGYTARPVNIDEIQKVLTRQ